MATASSIRTQVYDYLYGAYPTDRPFESILNEPLDNVETDIDVLDGDDWSKGDVVEVVETSELMRVLSVATNTLTVVRNYGETAATAAADKGLIRKNPRWTQEKVDRMVKQSLNTLGEWGIHGFNTGSITLAADSFYFEVTDTDIDRNYGVIAVYYADDNYEAPVSLPFIQHYQLDTTPTQWSAAQGVKLLTKGDRGATDKVFYTYARSYDIDTNLNTTLAKLERQSHEELVVLGAVTRLMGATIAPATQDPGARTDRSTPPGQTGRDGRWFQGEFFIKVRAAAASLAVERQRIAPGSVRTERAGRWRS